MGGLSLARTTDGAVTIDAPATANESDVFQVQDADDNAATNAITVQGNGHTIDGAASVTLSVNGTCAAFVFDGGEWKRALVTRPGVSLGCSWNGPRNPCSLKAW